MVWAWRAAVLAALLWAGYELHSLRRESNNGPTWAEEQHAQGVAKDIEAIRKDVSEIYRQLLRR